MNGRALYRIYCRKIHGKEAKEFVRVENDWYSGDCVKIITKDSKGNYEETDANYSNILFWLIKNLPNETVGFLEDLP